MLGPLSGLIYEFELRFEGGFGVEADEFFDRFAVLIVDHRRGGAENAAYDGFKVFYGVCAADAWEFYPLFASDRGVGFQTFTVAQNADN